MLSRRCPSCTAWSCWPFGFLRETQGGGATWHPRWTRTKRSSSSFTRYTVFFLCLSVCCLRTHTSSSTSLSLSLSLSVSFSLSLSLCVLLIHQASAHIAAQHFTYSWFGREYFDTTNVGQYEALMRHFRRVLDGHFRLQFAILSEMAAGAGGADTLSKLFATCIDVFFSCLVCMPRDQ